MSKELYSKQLNGERIEYPDDVNISEGESLVSEKEKERQDGRREAEV